ncbi:unnamed protein product [Orchesella dallaii]|uniref:Uncharacterized protein n=1 Tax=Orchesella dallaii TaxID=48710 RepID=A0ABP1PRF3_9HEXA
MEFALENIENEVYPQGDIKIINFPYQQDRRYSMDTEIPDRKVHTGQPENFRLARHFLDYVSLQEGEEPLDFKLRDISKEEQDEIDSLSTVERNRRIRQIIRRRYPAIVKLLPGVLISSEIGVVLEGFNKIAHIQQAKIDLSAIYTNYEPSGRTVRRRAAVLAEVNTLGQQNSQQVDEFDSPLPGPSTSCSMNEREDCKRTYNQAISAPERVMQDRKRFAGNGRRLEFEECVPVGTKGELRFTFFDDDFMGYARDKRVREVGPITPVAETLTRSVFRHANDATMTLANSVKIGEQFFGQGRAQIDLFKVNNYYQGHCVNFSLRETKDVIAAIIRSYYNASELTAEFHYDNEMKNVNFMEDEGNTEEAEIAREQAQKRYEDRMSSIRAARKLFEDAFQK